MKAVFIYALCEAGTRKVKYIGKSVNPKKRFNQHLSGSIKEKTYLGNWLRLLRSCGEKPVLVVLREVPGEHQNKWERGYIRVARRLGIKLVNGTDGGDGNLGGARSPETREKMRAIKKGKPPSPATIAAARAANLGRSQTPESNLKRSQSLKGVPKSPQHRASLSASLTGRPKSPEHRTNIGVSKKGVRQRRVSRGVPHSSERKAKISASLKSFWARR